MPGFEIPGLTISRNAGADLSGAQYRFVALDGEEVILPAAIGDQCIGVLQNDPLEGEAATVMVLGVSKIVLSATLLAGAAVMADAAGDAAAFASAAGDYGMGVLLTGGDDDDIGSVLLLHVGATA